MTANYWQIVLIIATFIAQLIAPSIAAFFASRSNRPKPTPQLNQPKNRIQRIGGWFMGLERSEIAMLVSPFFAALFPLYYLHKYLLDSAPITRSVVFIISLCVTLLWFNFLNFILNVSLIMVWRSTNHLGDSVISLSEYMLKESKTVSLIIDRTDDLYAKVEALAPKQLSQIETDKPTQGKLGKLLAVMKALFED
jgi:hypothetical protein